MNLFSLSYPRKEGRVDIYDYLRGVAMFLVVVQHSGLPFVQKFLCSFHMPLFFFLSGMVTGNKSVSLRFDRYVWARFQRLIIPYLFFGLIDILVYTLNGIFSHRYFDFLSAIKGVVLCQYGFVPDTQSGIYWFLYTMFIASILIYPIKKWLSGRKLNILLSVFIFSFLSLVSEKYGICKVFSIDKAFMASSFILLGGLVKDEIDSYLEKPISGIDYFVFIIGIVGVLLSCKMNVERVLMYCNQYGNVIWFYFGAISGIMSIIAGSKLLWEINIGGGKKYLLWLGFNSLLVFPVHLEVKTYISTFIKTITPSNYIILPIVFISMLFLTIPCVNFIIKYLPFLSGSIIHSNNSHVSK